ncbi:permease prefix domain 1-containing protein [Bacillus sp. 1P06AnD]|uniref:permease prefix domain 1-containing protein n=1 Tax=Bacillus sp. 1P06AnD TaxID=3132208 RepID=UPI0039A0F2FA
MEDRIQRYVDRIFEDYKESKQLHELKEEIKANLAIRIEEAMADGMPEEEAFQQGMKELGDISEVAEEISLSRKMEVYDAMYIRKPLGKKLALGYTIATGILLFGIITALIVFFQNQNLFTGISVFFPFAAISVTAFVFIGLTHETDQHYAMKKKRAAVYAIAALLLTIGLFISFIVYLERMGLTGQLEHMNQLLSFNNEAIFVAISTLVPFVLPAICLFVFLGLTETDRSKQTIWNSNHLANANPEEKEAIRAMMVHGNLSGALWIFAIGLFLVIGFFGSWAYSWLVFIFAIGIQVLLEAFYAGKRTPQA